MAAEGSNITTTKAAKPPVRASSRARDFAEFCFENNTDKDVFWGIVGAAFRWDSRPPVSIQRNSQHGWGNITRFHLPPKTFVHGTFLFHKYQSNSFLLYVELHPQPPSLPGSQMASSESAASPSPSPSPSPSKQVMENSTASSTPNTASVICKRFLITHSCANDVILALRVSKSFFMQSDYKSYTVEPLTYHFFPDHRPCDTGPLLILRHNVTHDAVRELTRQPSAKALLPNALTSCVSKYTTSKSKQHEKDSAMTSERHQTNVDVKTSGSRSSFSFSYFTGSASASVAAPSASTSAVNLSAPISLFEDDSIETTRDAVAFILHWIHTLKEHVNILVIGNHKPFMPAALRSEALDILNSTKRLQSEESISVNPQADEENEMRDSPQIENEHHSTQGANILQSNTETDTVHSKQSPQQSSAPRNNKKKRRDDSTQSNSNPWQGYVTNSSNRYSLLGSLLMDDIDIDLQRSGNGSHVRSNSIAIRRAIRQASLSLTSGTSAPSTSKISQDFAKGDSSFGESQRKHEHEYYIITNSDREQSHKRIRIQEEENANDPSSQQEQNIVIRRMRSSSVDGTQVLIVTEPHQDSAIASQEITSQATHKSSAPLPAPDTQASNPSAYECLLSVLSQSGAHKQIERQYRSAVRVTNIPFEKLAASNVRLQYSPSHPHRSVQLVFDNDSSPFANQTIREYDAVIMVSRVGDLLSSDVKTKMREVAGVPLLHLLTDLDSFSDLFEALKRREATERDLQSLYSPTQKPVVLYYERKLSSVPDSEAPSCDSTPIRSSKRHPFKVTNAGEYKYTLADEITVSRFFRELLDNTLQRIAVYRDEKDMRVALHKSVRHTIRRSRQDSLVAGSLLPRRRNSVSDLITSNNDDRYIWIFALDNEADAVEAALQSLSAFKDIKKIVCIRTREQFANASVDLISQTSTQSSRLSVRNWFAGFSKRTSPIPEPVEATNPTSVLTSPLVEEPSTPPDAILQSGFYLGPDSLSPYSSPVRPPPSQLRRRRSYLDLENESTSNNHEDSANSRIHRQYRKFSTGSIQSSNVENLYLFPPATQPISFNKFSSSIQASSTISRSASSQAISSSATGVFLNSQPSKQASTTGQGELDDDLASSDSASSEYTNTITSPLDQSNSIPRCTIEKQDIVVLCSELSGRILLTGSNGTFENFVREVRKYTDTVVLFLERLDRNDICANGVVQVDDVASGSLHDDSDNLLHFEPWNEKLDVKREEQSQQSFSSSLLTRLKVFGSSSKARAEETGGTMKLSYGLEDDWSSTDASPKPAAVSSDGLSASPASPPSATSIEKIKLRMGSTPPRAGSLSCSDSEPEQPSSATKTKPFPSSVVFGDSIDLELDHSLKATQNIASYFRHRLYYYQTRDKRSSFEKVWENILN